MEGWAYLSPVHYDDHNPDIPAIFVGWRERDPLQGAKIYSGTRLLMEQVSGYRFWELATIRTKLVGVELITENEEIEYEHFVNENNGVSQ